MPELNLVPAVTAPVRQLKERFTLSGEPLPISTCMKQLDMEINKETDGVYCEYSLPKGRRQCYVFTADQKWESAIYAADTEGFETKEVSETHVLAGLLLRYYRLYGKTKQKPEVLSSLSARFIAQAQPDQVSWLKGQIKSL
jgi:hypothetical protein